MQNLRTNLVAITVVGTLMVTGYLMSPREAIAGGPSVTIANPLPLPVEIEGTASVSDADHPDRNAFRGQLCIECTDAPTSLTAPPDRNIVIDLFSGECSIENAGDFRSMRAFLNDIPFHQFIPERASVGTSHTIYQWNKQTRLVIPADETFRVSVSAVGGELAFCRMFVTGYTVTP